jgi:predicted regulator of Ras-like GTPase activity (Roadblock/LC7/MglB family)
VAAVNTTKRLEAGDITVVTIDGRNRAVVIISVHHGLILARIKDSDTYIITTVREGR